MAKISDDKLRELRKAVRGKYQDIANITGFSYPTVQKVLSGAWENDIVIMAAIGFMDQKKAESKALESRI